MENLSVFDPFTLLGFEKTYFLNLESLDRAYFDAQKKTHPDQFHYAPEDKKQEAAQHSIAINKAYALLKDPLARAEYLLEEEGKSEMLPSSEFLEKIMLWQVQKEANSLSLVEIEIFEQDLLQELQHAFTHNQREKARETISKLRYIRRLL